MVVVVILADITLDDTVCLTHHISFRACRQNTIYGDGRLREGLKVSISSSNGYAEPSVSGHRIPLSIRVYQRNSPETGYGSLNGIIPVSSKVDQRCYICSLSSVRFF